MRIAQITQHYRPIVGGQEVYIANLQKVFGRVGITSHVYQPYRPGGAGADTTQVFRIRGLGKLIKGCDPYLVNLALLAMKSRIARADVLIAHYALSTWAVKSLRAKTIVLSHGIEWHNDHMSWDDRARRSIARSCLNDFTHVVNDTHYLRHFGFDVKPGTGYFSEILPGKWFIPNCVDTEMFTRTSGVASLKRLKVILVPRQFTPDRGIDLAIRAFKLFNEQKKGYVLYLVGKGEPLYYQRCVALVRQLNLQDHVVFHPHVEHDAMRDWYSSATLTMIPSLRREGTSLSALESMSCGTPVVSTNIEGLKDLPTLQADPTDSALASALLQAMEGRDLLAAQQCDLVRNRFNLSHWSAAWLKVVNLVAQRSN